MPSGTLCGRPGWAAAAGQGKLLQGGSWTNTGGSAINAYVRAFRFSSTRTTYQLKISF